MKKISGSSRSRRKPAARRSLPSAEVALSRPSCPTKTGLLVDEADAGSLRRRDPLRTRQPFRRRRHPAPCRTLRSSPVRRPARSPRRRDGARRRLPRMVRRATTGCSPPATSSATPASGSSHSSRLTPCGSSRTDSSPGAHHQRRSAIPDYLYVMPFVAVLVPLAFQLQGLYRLRRGPLARRRLLRRLRRQHRWPWCSASSRRSTSRPTSASDAARDTGALRGLPASVWAIFLVLNIALTYAIARTRARGARNAAGALASASSAF